MDIFAPTNILPVFIDIDVNSLAFILLILLAITLFIQLFYHWFYFSRLAFHRQNKEFNANPELPAVSIIICARNEYSNLSKNIPIILAQNYREFELVIVNDCSDDGSDELLEDFSRSDSRVSVINLRQSLNFFRGKKFPLSIGIKSARYEHLLLTDADCKPASEDWIKTILQNYTNEIDIVLGFSPYEKRAGILNWLIRYDTLNTAIQYLSFALAGKAYMGVGRNLSYKKSLFMKNKGFTAHYDIPSGDDDIFISQVSTASNTAVAITPSSQTISLPKETFSNWIRQKRRHLSTGHLYKTRTKILLGLYLLSQFVFYAIFTALFFTQVPLYMPLTLYIIRLASLEIIIIWSGRKLQYATTWLLLPLAEIFFIIFNFSMAVYNRFAKPDKWM